MMTKCTPRVEGEDNWNYCLRMAESIDKDELIQRLLMKIAEMRRPRDRSLPLWSFVGDASSNGSGVSCAVCAIYGVNSDTGAKKEKQTAQGAGISPLA